MLCLKTVPLKVACEAIYIMLFNLLMMNLSQLNEAPAKFKQLAVHVPLVKERQHDILLPV